MRTLLPTDGWKGMTHPINKGYFDFNFRELCMGLYTDSCPILCRVFHLDTLRQLE